MDNAVEIAKQVITRCMEKGKPTRNLLLQTQMYYIQKAALKLHGEPAYSESIEAWGFGPCVPAVYYRYGGFGVTDIDVKFNTCLHWNTIKLVDYVLNELDQYSDYQLLSHMMELTSWKTVWKEGKGRGKEIPNTLIYDKFLIDDDYILR